MRHAAPGKTNPGEAVRRRCGLKTDETSGSDKEVNNPDKVNNNGPGTPYKLMGGLLVSNLKIKNGTFEFYDQVTDHNTRIDNINLQVRDVSFERPFPIELTARLPGNDRDNLKLSCIIPSVKISSSEKGLIVPGIEDVIISVSSFDLNHIKQ